MEDSRRILCGFCSPGSLKDPHRVPFFEVLLHHFHWDFGNWGNTLKPASTLAVFPVFVA